MRSVVTGAFHSGTRFRLGLLVAVLGFPVLCGAQTQQTFQVLSQISTSRRFVAQGPDRVWNMTLLIRMEQIARRLETLVRRPIPISPESPMRVIVLPDTEGAAGVTFQEIFDAGEIHQRIYVRRPDLLDPSEVEDRVILLAFLRWARASLPGSARAKADCRVPDWLAMGLTDYLSPDLRRASYARVRDLWREGRLPTWETLAAQTVIAEERDSNTRALCAALVGWITTLPDSRNRWAELMILFGQGRVGSEEIRSVLLGPVADARDVDIQWNLWCSSLDTRMPGIFQDPEIAVMEIRSCVTLPGILLEGVGDDPVPERITARTLLDHRGADWIPSAALRMSQALSRLNRMALPRNLQPVPDLLLGWLADVAEPEP
ncbi:MAG: hypothetical protein U1E27_11815, partial [Kiritimatiellia bacterium]|nr:hypothetical protein [Kiritimatiellia bacterium]